MYGVQREKNRQVRGLNLTACVSLFLGINDVLPYIQSGNVVFNSDDTDVARLQRQIEDGFERKFGFHVEVFVRTSAELREIVEQNPFQSQQSKESRWVVVMFLAALP